MLTRLVALNQPFASLKVTIEREAHYASPSGRGPGEGNQNKDVIANYTV